MYFFSWYIICCCGLYGGIPGTNVFASLWLQLKLSFLSSPQPVHWDLLKMKSKLVPGFTWLIAGIPVQECSCHLQRFIGIPFPPCLFLLPCISKSTSSDLRLAISSQQDTKGEGRKCLSSCLLIYVLKQTVHLLSTLWVLPAAPGEDGK